MSAPILTAPQGDSDSKLAEIERLWKLRRHPTNIPPALDLLLSILDEANIPRHSEIPVTTVKCPFPSGSDTVLHALVAIQKLTSYLNEHHRGNGIPMAMYLHEPLKNNLSNLAVWFNWFLDHRSRYWVYKDGTTGIFYPLGHIMQLLSFLFMTPLDDVLKDMVHTNEGLITFWSRLWLMRNGDVVFWEGLPTCQTTATYFPADGHLVIEMPGPSSCYLATAMEMISQNHIAAAIMLETIDRLRPPTHSNRRRDAATAFSEALLSRLAQMEAVARLVPSSAFPALFFTIQSLLGIVQHLATPVRSTHRKPTLSFERAYYFETIHKGSVFKRYKVHDSLRDQGLFGKMASCIAALLKRLLDLQASEGIFPTTNPEPAYGRPLVLKIFNMFWFAGVHNGFIESAGLVRHISELINNNLLRIIAYMAPLLDAIPPAKQSLYQGAISGTKDLLSMMLFTAFFKLAYHPSILRSAARALGLGSGPSTISIQELERIHKVLGRTSKQALDGVRALWGMYKAFKALDSHQRPVICDNPTHSETWDGNLIDVYKTCSRCQEPKYCSQSCQKVHWKAKHNERCEGARELHKAAKDYKLNISHRCRTWLAFVLIRHYIDSGIVEHVRQSPQAKGTSTPHKATFARIRFEEDHPVFRIHPISDYVESCVKTPTAAPSFWPDFQAEFLNWAQSMPIVEKSISVIDGTKRVVANALVEGHFPMGNKTVVVNLKLRIVGDKFGKLAGKEAKVEVLGSMTRILYEASEPNGVLENLVFLCAVAKFYSGKEPLTGLSGQVVSPRRLGT